MLHCGRLPDGRDVEVIDYRESGRLWTGIGVQPRAAGFVGSGDRLLPGRAIEIQGYETLDNTKTVVSGKASLRVGAVATRIAG